MDLNYHSMESLLEAAKENNCRLSALVLEQQAEQMELPKQEIYEKMRENYRVMASCIQPGSAPDLKRDMTHSSSVSWYCSCMVSTAAGTMPQLPAVGAATILPMEAFSSDTARAR